MYLRSYFNSENLRISVVWHFHWDSLSQRTWRQWLGLGIAGISKKTLLDEIEKKIKTVVENAKPANFNSTANDNHEDNHEDNETNGDDSDDSSKNIETDLLAWFFYISFVDFIW